MFSTTLAFVDQTRQIFHILDKSSLSLYLISWMNLLRNDGHFFLISSYKWSPLWLNKNKFLKKTLKTIDAHAMTQGLHSNKPFLKSWTKCCPKRINFLSYFAPSFLSLLFWKLAWTNQLDLVSTLAKWAVLDTWKDGWGLMGS